MVRRTKEEAQETRSRLLNAAEILFQTQGVSQTSLQQIANQAGTTRGAIYWHFKDKAALFNAMMDRVMLPLEAQLSQAVGSQAEAMDALESRLVDALELMIRDAQVCRVFDIALHKVEYSPDMEAVQQRHLAGRNACVMEFEQAMCATVRQIGRQLPIAAPAAAHGLHALISGLIQNWLLDPGAFDLVATGRQAFRVYLSGLGFNRADAASSDR